MYKISTDRIQSDCIAAADVISPSGNVLVQKGESITPALGRRLRNWGIGFVQIEGGDNIEHDDVHINVVSFSDIKSELYAMFVGTLGNPRMRKIFNAVCAYKQQKIDGKAP